MTLDEAIIHCEEVAETNERICATKLSVGLPDIYNHKDEAKKCADEHRQLAKWLIELKQYKDASNHPETVTEFADRCRECGAKYGKLLKQEPCDDAISRQALIDALVNATDIAERCGTVDKEESKRYLSEFIRWIKGFPPVIPQQRTGWWKAFTHSAYHGNDEDGEPIWREVTVYHCNLCNRRTVIKEKYCPSCGAKMEEVKE